MGGGKNGQVSIWRWELLIFRPIVGRLTGPVLEGGLCCYVCTTRIGLILNIWFWEILCSGFVLVCLLIEKFCPIAATTATNVRSFSNFV